MTMKELWMKANENENADFIFYLYERWQDEKDYEDIADYLKALQKRISEAFKMTKRPFGVVCKCEDGEIHIFIKKEGNYLKMIGKMTRK